MESQHTVNYSVSIIMLNELIESIQVLISKLEANTLNNGNNDANKGLIVQFVQQLKNEAKQFEHIAL